MLAVPLHMVRKFETGFADVERRDYRPLPDSIGVAGPFVGVHGDALIVAGGANFPRDPFGTMTKRLA